MSKPWQTSSWKKKRKEFLKDKECEWCGSRKALAVHHTKHFKALDEYKKIVTEFVRNYFSKRKHQTEKEELLTEVKKKIKTKYSNHCPKCGHSVYARKTLFPKYKCSKCSSVTNSPVKRVKVATKISRRKTFRRLFLAKHKEEIDKAYTLRKLQLNKEYLDFKNVEVLCKRCHFAKEKGLVLCEVCGNAYHKPNRGKCWSCFLKTNGGKAFVKYNKPRQYP